MHALHQVFDHNHGRKLLSIYFTAGFPTLKSTGEIISALSESGVDFIEVGIPFSDPLADGPTIQESSMRALKNGMTVSILLEQLSEINVDTPLILMGYLNPVLQYGVEKFCERCADIGIAGVILPDLPLDVYIREYASLFYTHGVSNIFLVSPQTSVDRIRMIDAHSTSFIYAVSSSSTTGSAHKNADKAYLEKLKNLKLIHPIITGFNIKDRASFDHATLYTRGGIIGSAFINAIDSSIDLRNDIRDFVKSIQS